MLFHGHAHTAALVCDMVPVDVMGAIVVMPRDELVLLDVAVIMSVAMDRNGAGADIDVLGKHKTEGRISDGAAKIGKESLIGPPGIPSAEPAAFHEGRMPAQVAVRNRKPD